MPPLINPNEDSVSSNVPNDYSASSNAPAEGDSRPHTVFPHDLEHSANQTKERDNREKYDQLVARTKDFLEERSKDIEENDFWISMRNRGL